MYLEEWLNIVEEAFPFGGPTVDRIDRDRLRYALRKLGTELLLSRPTRPGGLAEEARTPRRMAACLEKIVAQWGDRVPPSREWADVDRELEAMGFLPAHHADAGGEP